MRIAAPGNDLGFLGTAGQNSLCLTHSLPILFTSFLHLTSCLGPCMLTAAQVTVPQTWQRPALEEVGGEKGGYTTGSVTGRSIGLSWE